MQCELHERRPVRFLAASVLIDITSARKENIFFVKSCQIIAHIHHCYLAIYNCVTFSSDVSTWFIYALCLSWISCVGVGIQVFTIYAANSIVSHGCMYLDVASSSSD